MLPYLYHLQIALYIVYCRHDVRLSVHACYYIFYRVAIDTNKSVAIIATKYLLTPTGGTYIQPPMGY